MRKIRDCLRCWFYWRWRRKAGEKMTEYITKDQVKKAISDYADSLGFDADTVPVEYLSDEINAIPTADVAPVVHARWKEAAADTPESGNLEIVECSACNGRFTGKGEKDNFDEIFILKEIAIKYLKFCPFCGAKMDGEESGE